jgi:hypothetical protein
VETVEKQKPFSHCSHRAWKTLRQKGSEFPTVPTASAAGFSDSFKSGDWEFPISLFIIRVHSEALIENIEDKDVGESSCLSSRFHVVDNYLD